MKFYNSRRVVYVPFNFAYVPQDKLEKIAKKLQVNLSSFNDAGALLSALKSAYRKKLKSVHPDLHPEDKDKYTRMTQELNSLYEPITQAVRSPEGFEWNPGSGNTSGEDTAGKAQEEAERKSREDAARKAREEAARKAREEAAKKAREEAAKKAWEDLASKARRAREEAARKAREESEKRHGFQEDDRFRQRAEEDPLRNGKKQEDPYSGKEQEDLYSGAESLFKNWRETNPHWKYRKEKEKRDRWAGLDL